MRSSVRYHPMAKVFAGLIPVAFVVSGCGSIQPKCRPTVTKARDAAAADVTDVNRSMVLEARLTWNGHPLKGKTLTFSLHRRDTYAVDRGSSRDDVTAGRANTDTRGTARVDLKNEELDAFLHDVFAERFTAKFGGDKTYCASSGSAKMSLVSSPAGNVDWRPQSTPPVRFTPKPVAVPPLVPKISCLTPPVPLRACLPSTNGLDPHLTQ